MLRFLYERTDENHPATVSDIIAHLNGKGIQAVRQTVYADTNTLIDAGIDIVVVKSTQNQYFMGSRLFEYPELKMLTDAVASVSYTHLVVLADWSLESVGTPAYFQRYLAGLWPHNG